MGDDRMLVGGVARVAAEIHDEKIGRSGEVTRRTAPSLR